MPDNIPKGVKANICVARDKRERRKCVARRLVLLFTTRLRKEQRLTVSKGTQAIWWNGTFFSNGGYSTQSERLTWKQVKALIKKKTRDYLAYRE